MILKILAQLSCATRHQLFLILTPMIAGLAFLVDLDSGMVSFSYRGRRRYSCSLSECTFIRSSQSDNTS